MKTNNEKIEQNLNELRVIITDFVETTKKFKPNIFSIVDLQSKKIMLHLCLSNMIRNMAGLPKDERAKITQEAKVILEDARAALKNFKKGL